MFIDVTRYGGMRILRVAVAAIAYLDTCEGGAAVHLIGGETLRVNEDPAQIEQRVDATLSLSATAAGFIDPALELAGADSLEAAGVISAEDAVEMRISAVQPRRKGRRA